MAKVSALKALTEFFQVEGGTSVESAGGDIVPATIAGVPSKRPMKAWADEVKALTPEAKAELAALAVAALNAMPERAVNQLELV